MDNGSIVWLLVLLVGFFFAKRVNTQSRKENLDNLTRKTYQQGIASEIIETETVTTKTTKIDNTSQDNIDGGSDEDKSVDSEDDEIKKPVVRTKRVVTKDMIEIVQTLAPHLHQDQINLSLQKTGSIELTIEDVMQGKNFPFPEKNSSDKTKELDKEEKEKSDK